MADPSAPDAEPSIGSPADAVAKSGSSEVLIPGFPDPAPDASPSALAFFRPDAIPFVLLVVVATAIGVRLANRAADRLAERAGLRRLAVKQGVALLGFAAYGLMGIVAVSSLFELSAQALFALSGTLAVAGGFLLKDFAQATFAGLSILFTRPFQVGDRIRFGEYYGEVTEIGLRTVRLVTLDDNLVSIPSDRFLEEPVASANAGALDCMVVVPFYVAARADHDRARQIVHDAVMSSRYLYLGKPVTVLVSMELVGEVGAVVQLTAKAYVFDARFEKAFASDITDRVLRSFRKEEIDLPVAATAATAMPA